MAIDLQPGVLLLPATAGEQAWLAARRHGIGASEIAAAAGLSRRRGPWDVWASKVDGTEWEPTDVMRWGQWIESRIIEWWARETGRDVGSGGLWCHAEHAWLIATPDALVLDHTPLGGNGLVIDAVVDAKSAGWYTTAEWDDGAPLDYLCQATWQMLAVGVRTAYLVATIGGAPPVERRISLDEELAQALIARGADLWQHVIERTVPPVDGSAHAARWLADRYPEADPDAAVDLDDADITRVRELVYIGHRIKHLEQVEKGLTNLVKERLGTATLGIHDGRTYVTWKQVDRRGYTVEPTTYRKLTIPAAIKKELDPDGDHD